MSEQEDDTHELIARALVRQAEARVAGAREQVLGFNHYLMEEGHDRPPTLLQYVREHIAPEDIEQFAARVTLSKTIEYRVIKHLVQPTSSNVGGGRFKNRHNYIRDLWVAGLMHELVTQHGRNVDAAAREAIKDAPGRAWHLYQEMREQNGCSEDEAARAAVRTLGDAARRRLTNILADDGKRGLPHSPERALHTVLEDWRKAKRGASMAKKSALAAYAEFFGN